MGVTQLRLRFQDREAFRRELQNNLRHGRAFVPEKTNLQAFETCELLLLRGEDEQVFVLQAQAIFFSTQEPMIGVGLQLLNFDANKQQALERFIDAPPVRFDDLPLPDMDIESSPSTTEEPVETANEDDEEEGEEHQRLSPRHEQLRNLKLPEVMRIARQGEMNDRVILERLYGKTVWEELLKNPKISVPEVAKIAKKGTVPRPLIESICENNGWIQSSLVRRALLTNPRLSNESAMKLLRLTPKTELRSLCKTALYPLAIREMARKMLDG